MKKTVLKIVSTAIALLTLGVVFVMNVTTGERMYAGKSPDGQYSYYLSPYICWKFVNLIDAQGSGKVFLFDEVTKQQLGTCEVDEISLLDAPVFWDYKMYFKTEDVTWNAGTPFVLPRKVEDKEIPPSLPQINQSFPFGATALSTMEFPKKWKADESNYGQLVNEDRLAFEQLNQTYTLINKQARIGSFAVRTLEQLNLEDPHRLHPNYDQEAARALTTCRYRLPDINQWQCYYFTGMAQTQETYGNLCFYEPETKAVKLINVFFNYAGDQHVNYRFFRIDQEHLYLYDGACYDDGCDLNPTFKIDFANGPSLELIDLRNIKPQ